MADDARISTALPRHPKTVKLLRRLETRGGWALICLFLWVAENRPDGNLEGLTAEDIEIAAGWSGEPGVFVSSIVEVGFLDGTEGSYVVHDWAEHNPWAANRGRRIEAARNAANSRWEGRAGNTANSCDPYAPRIRPASESHAKGNADSMPTTQPNPTQPNPTQPNEKRKTPARAPLALPDWLPSEQWNGFVEMRRRIKAPLTDRAINLIVKRLEALKADGYDVGAVLDQSTRNNWKDVYPLKGDYVNGNGNRAERQQSSNLAALEIAKAHNRPI